MMTRPLLEAFASNFGEYLENLVEPQMRVVLDVARYNYRVNADDRGTVDGTGSEVLVLVGQWHIQLHRKETYNWDSSVTLCSSKEIEGTAHFRSKYRKSSLSLPRLSENDISTPQFCHNTARSFPKWKTGINR